MKILCLKKSKTLTFVDIIASYFDNIAGIKMRNHLFPPSYELLYSYNVSPQMKVQMDRTVTFITKGHGFHSVSHP
jgi:hypothetical protein